MSDHIEVYLACLESYGKRRYVSEQRAAELLQTYQYQLDPDELLQRFPADTAVGRLIRENIKGAQ